MACLQRVPYTPLRFGRAPKAAVEQGVAAYHHVYAMPKKPARQARASRSRREVEPPQQPHIVSFRLSPTEFEQLNSHLAETGINRSDFVRRAVMSTARGEMKFTEVMPMAVTGKRLRALEAENARLKKLLAEAALGIEVLKEINAKKW